MTHFDRGALAGNDANKGLQWACTVWLGSLHSSHITQKKPPGVAVLLSDWASQWTNTEWTWAQSATHKPRRLTQGFPTTPRLQLCSHFWWAELSTRINACGEASLRWFYLFVLFYGAFKGQELMAMLSKMVLPLLIFNFLILLSC